MPSFSGYINKVFHFRKALSTLRDRRQNPDISPKTIFLSLFYAFVFRFTSFRQLEADLAQPHLQRWAETPRAFGDDVLRYSLASFELAPLEQMVVEINRRLKRNKALDAGRVQGRVVAALDGIEVLYSFSRCCEFCLQRRMVCPNDQGQPVEQIQYYHRLVGCQIVSSPSKPILALEWIRPGEAKTPWRYACCDAYRTLWQPFLRHPATGFPLRPGAGSPAGRRDRLGSGHHPETGEPHAVPITALEAKTFSIRKVRQLGHDR